MKLNVGVKAEFSTFKYEMLNVKQKAQRIEGALQGEGFFKLADRLRMKQSNVKTTGFQGAGKRN